MQTIHQNMALNRTEILVAKFDRATKFCCGIFDFGICTFPNISPTVDLLLPRVHFSCMHGPQWEVPMWMPAYSHRLVMNGNRPPWKKTPRPLSSPFLSWIFGNCCP